jgi:DNA-binding MarR family transcriptional regulator
MSTASRHELTRAIASAMRLLGLRSRLFDQAVANHLGINETDLLCLQLMNLEGSEMTASRLAELAGLTSGAITGVIDRLERAGYVSREGDPLDRRRVIVRVKPGARWKLTAIFEPLSEGEAELCRGFTDDQLNTILDHAQRGAVLLEQLAADLSGQGRTEEAGEDISGEVSAPLGSVTEGLLRFTAGAAKVALGAEADPDELYRGRFERFTPDIRVKGGTITVDASRSRPGRRRVEGRLDLNPTIPWDIELRGGATTMRADLTGLDVRSVAVAGGASHVRLHLPRPRGEVVIRLTGGASHVEIDRPEGVPVRARVRAGASRLAVDGERFSGLGGHNRWESEGFRDATDRYVVEVSGGASDVTVRTRA